MSRKRHIAGGILSNLEDAARSFCRDLVRAYSWIAEKRRLMVDFVRAYFVDKTIVLAHELFTAFETEDQEFLVKTAAKHRITFNFGTAA